MHDFLNEKDWLGMRSEFLANKPFDHIVIDNFFKSEVAEKLASEFPEYDSPVWHAYYNNAIERKKTSNHWDKFPKQTYAVFHYLCTDFNYLVTKITGNYQVQADIGLHGGGWHAHKTNGKLNVHLDYSLHPKLELERHYNLIVYITPNWNPEWGGGLEIWSHNHETNQPKEQVGVIENKFNRAVLFDTTQHSWHGLPKDLNCPEGIMRQSLAVYYVSPPQLNVDPRGKALFVPHEDQINDPEVVELIKKRADLSTAASVYRT